MVIWRVPFVVTGAIALCSVVSAQQQQQGSIRGVVLDKEFDAPLAGVQVQIVETGQKVATSDQGNYVIGVAPGRYTLVFAKDGYVRQLKSDVLVAAGRLTDVNMSLSGDFTDMEEFVVQDALQLGAGSEGALLQLRLESPALMDSIGSDLMSRAGASDAAGALRLVSGATVQNGKSAVIRGLPDRYVSSQINNVRMPSADEDKRAVELDQFPAEVIDSIQVSKTFTPDQQGDASGGAVNVKLRGIPEEPFFVRLRGQAKYNTQVGGRGNFLTYPGGGVHFDGRDSGDRNQQLDRLGDNWLGAVGVSEGEAPDMYKMSMAAGGRHEFEHGLKIGAFGSFSYDRDASFFTGGRDDSWWVERPGSQMTPRQVQGTVLQEDFRTQLFDLTQASQSVQWSGLAAFGIAQEQQSLDFVFLRTHVAQDKVTLAEDTRGKHYFYPGYDPADPSSPGYDLFDAAPYLRLETLEYTERTTETMQLNGKHVLPFEAAGGFLPPEIDWTLSRNSASLYQPDKRQFGSLWVPERRIGSFVIPATHRPFKPAANFTLGNLQRIWKSIDEESEQGAVNVKLPFEDMDGSKGYLKFGLFQDKVERKFDQDTFSNFNDNSTFAGPWQQYWSASFPFGNHPITDSQLDVDYDGRQKIFAYYGMLDLPVTSFLHVIGGARVESTKLSVVNDPEPDALWFPPGSSAPTQLNPGDADVDYRKDNLLPALALVLDPVDKVTLRASYAQTIARQTFKELTPILQQEYLGGPIFIGNPDLQMSELHNYDLRLDYTPYEGGLWSASWFYKDIKGAIEYVQRIVSFDYTTAVNYPKGKMSGVELETRQQLGKFWEPLTGFGAGANATWIRSEVTLPEDEAAGFLLPNIAAPMPTRDMTNAPEYLVNFYLTYDIPDWGTQLAVFYTRQGDALTSGAGQATGNYVPNIYALGYDTLNASISQMLGKHVRLQFQAKNLTNPDIQTAYRSDYIGADVLRTSYTQGIEYSFSIGFELRF